MRKIKFRVWEPFNKAMCHDPFVEGRYGWCDQNNNLRCSSNFASNHLILMQYVGLEDKNGKEIYEDDICSFDYNKELLKGVVKFSNTASFGIRLKEAFFSFDYIHSLQSEVEIIGNIHQNKPTQQIIK